MLSASSASSSPAPPRGRNRSWHSESVGRGSFRLRRSALGKLPSEIEFAFRAPASNPSGEIDDDDGNSNPENRVIQGPLPSGSTVVTVQLRKRTRPASTSEPFGGRRRLVSDGTDRTREHRLAWDVNDLRQELQRLRDYKCALETRTVFRSIATRNTVYKATNAYFTMFANGFENGPHARTHEAFLRSVVDPDILTCSQLRGADALVEQWRRYSDFFELRDYKLRSVHATSMDATPILEVECGYHVFVTWRTLEQLFPHVLGDPYLVQRVLGKKLECDSRVTFVFDTDGKILRYDDDSDFVAAFARLLRNPHDLAALMSKALITERSLIGDLASSAHVQDDSTQVENCDHTSCENSDISCESSWRRQV